MRLYKIFYLLLFALLIGCNNQKLTDKTLSEGIYYEEEIVVGGPDDFMEVRHVVLKGTNSAIGKKIAEIAQKSHVRVVASGDTLKNRLQREYMRQNYPIHYERMKGLAAGFGLEFEDNRYDFSHLSQITFPAGCSVVFYPGKFTESKHSMLSRNFDFTTGTVEGRHPRTGESPVLAHPYIFEIYPDTGYAALFICAFDLLGGVLDGINSAGLAVAILADSESPGEFPREPSWEVGVHELLSMRYLLDNCKNVQEAKEALLKLKHFYSFASLHYIVGDKSGKSFIFEFSPSRNKTFIIDSDSPQCLTNHLVSRHRSIKKLPDGFTFERYKILSEAISSKQAFSISEIKEINSRVSVPPLAFYHLEYAPPRTLWHSLYDLEQKTMQVKFYLGEEPIPDDKEKVKILGSEYYNFSLKNSLCSGFH